MTKFRIIKFLLRGLALLVTLAQIINWSLVGAGLIVIAYQVYSYLRIGHWPSISLFTTIFHYSEYLGIIGNWAKQSHSWPGLNQAMKFMPLSIFLIFCGFFIEFISQGKLKEYVTQLTEKHLAKNHGEQDTINRN